MEFSAKIRKLQKRDMSQLVILEDISHAVPWSEDAFKHCFDAGYSGWGFEVEGKVIGFVIMSVQAGESHILNLCVDPRYQRQGFGNQLMEYALAEAIMKGAIISYLEVRRSNTRAIRLYMKMGFIQIGERKDYYPVPTGREDALVFAKNLSVK